MFSPGALITDAPTVKNIRNDLSYLEGRIAPFRYNPWSKHPILIHKHKLWKNKNDFKSKLTLIKKEQESDRFGNCFIFAATEILGITGQAANKLPISHPEFIITVCNFLQYFDQIPMPKPGCLAVYSDYTSDIKHFAVVTQVPNKNTCYVKGKWGSCPNIDEHELFCTPKIYGDLVSFHELLPQYRNNTETILSFIQKDLNESLENKKQMIKLEQLMIQFAHNNNIASKLTDNNTPEVSIYIRSLYLFKNYLGLDVNTCDDNGKTLLTLAKENNNIPLLNLLLAMGAKHNEQDNDTTDHTMECDDQKTIDYLPLH
jgi:hypothetical protein